MTQSLASFTANNGTGLWEVLPAGIRVGGNLYHFTDVSHITCCGLPGRTERHVHQIEEDDGPALWEALAVYWETGSLNDAALTAWALGGTSVRTEVENRVIPGNVQLSIGGLSRGRRRDLSLCYREDGRWVQVDAIQHFATVALSAIGAYRNRPR